MLRRAPFAYTLALFRDGELRHAEPVPESLVKRICRAAQFQAVRHGRLPVVETCRARLQPVGRPNRRAYDEPASFFAQALDVVVETNGAAYTRELDLNVLVPWVKPIALALSVTDGENGGGSYDFRLAVDAPDGTEGWGGHSLSPFTVARSEQEVVSLTTSLEPLDRSLDYADDLPILMSAAALAENIAHCQADPTVERAGVFLGYLSQDRDGRLFVDAQHFCPAQHTEATVNAVRFTKDTWADINAHRRELGADLQVVAWSHSHPRPEATEPSATSPFFLSPDDLAIMDAFFDLPHVVAIVVDAEGSGDPSAACAVYGWDRAGVGLVQRSLDLY